MLASYLEQRYKVGHMDVSLLAWFPIWGHTCYSLPLKQWRWWKQYCSCQDDGNVCHCCPWSTSNCAWGVLMTCGLHETHDGWCSSFHCCLSESRNKSKKEFLNKSNFFSRQGVCTWWRGLVIMHCLVTHFLEVIAFAIILLLVWLFALVVLVFMMRVIIMSLSWWQLPGHRPLWLHRLLQW